MGFGNEVANALSVMRNEKQLYRDYLPEEAIHAGQMLVQCTEGLWSDVLKKIVKMVRDELPLEYPHVAVWWYSVLIRISKDEELFLEFVRYVRKRQETFSVNTRYFLFYQLSSLLFRFKELDGESKEELWKFYREIVDNFAQYIEASLLEEIPVQERCKDVVVVITEQFIVLEHGPTKTALDRCKALITELGKKVLLINDAEVLSLVGRIPFYGAIRGNYMPEKRGEISQEWKGVVVPYYQCENNMPNFEEVTNLVQKIRAIAPERIISIGKGGILANLAGRMIPMLTIGLCPSDLEYTTGKYQTLGRHLNKSDKRVLKEMGYTENHVIESIFTSSLKPQEEHIMRADIGIPENTFLMIVIGARLNFEVTSEFRNMLENLLEPDMHVGFLGEFDQYENYVSSFSKLKAQSSYLGFCSDILSRLEVCDLYVNPIRKGGGTSCVEAMFMGIPVVSVNYGDVAINAGEEFCVEDYTEMSEMILKYYSDKEFYHIKSLHARERANVLLDTDREFVRIIHEMDRREAESILHRSV
ncbi:MAG: glycosyltransferase [Lachnospiraceae bacterium]|nr:glycosyltransferase [Lachnospiraceae bacterium]